MVRIPSKNKISPFVVTIALCCFLPAAYAIDTDGDGVDDNIDNCSQVANPSQFDSNGDGLGNACDPDTNNDLIVNFGDIALFSSVFLTNDADHDFNGDGAVNFPDFVILTMFFTQPPGPGPLSTFASDVSPIFLPKCAPCHTGLGLGGHNVATTYADALNPAGHPSCSGLNVGQCTIVRIQSGQMPPGAGCTGNPVLDAGNSSCLTAVEQQIVQNWIDGGLLP